MKVSVVAPAFAAILAVGLMAGTCEQSVKGVSLPHPPAYYKACFEKLTPIPAGDLTRADVVRLVAQLRHSELAKSRCGKDLLNWYDTVVVAYGK